MADLVPLDENRLSDMVRGMPDTLPPDLGRLASYTPEQCAALVDSTLQVDPCPSAEAARLARHLLGCFRRTDYFDVDVFATALAATFGLFPVSVGRQVADPIHGLPSRSKFPPTLAEVREALEAASKERHRLALWAAWILQRHPRGSR